MHFPSPRVFQYSVVLSVILFAFAGAGPSAVAGGPPPDSANFAPPSSAFHPEAGRVFRRYIGPETYGATRQNWDAVQDSSGRLYVGNTAGVLLYDGHEWRTLSTANGSPAVSMAATEDGQVYVGAKGDFGWIRTDSVGRPQYESLLRNVPKKHRSVGEILRTVVADGDVYFQSKRRIFRWTPGTHTMRVWKLSGTEFQQNASVVRDTLYVNVGGKGLMAVLGDSLELVPGGAQFADRSVRFLLPHGDNGLLVGAFGGFFLRDGSSFRPFRTDADSLLQDAWLYAGRRLRDGTIAVATIDHGLLLLAPDGTMRRHLRARGQPVTGLYEDREGGLWALLDGGLLRYDFGAPFTTFGKGTGIEGIVFDLARHDGALYAATMKATYRLRTPPDTIASFERVGGVRGKTKDTPSWCFLSVGTDLLIGTAYGLVRRRSSGEAEYLFRDAHVFDLIRSRRDSSRVYAASKAGIRVLRQVEGTWKVQQTIPLSEDPRMMAEDNDGQLWVGTSPDQLYRIRGLVSGDSVRADRFGPSHGLPEGPIGPYRWQGTVVFGTRIGVFSFRPNQTSPFASLPALEPPSTGQGAGRVYTQADRRGRAWGTTGRGPGRWRREGGVWRWRPGVLHRLKGERARTVRVEDGGRTVWFGLWGGKIVRHTPDQEWRRSPMPALVHRVYEYDTDSLLSAETPYGPKTRGGVRVTYGSPSLVQPQDIRYQYKMEGQNAEWSEWTARTEQTYRTLSPGRYTFAVRARLAYGDTTEAARFSFTVPPPWYRTGWAYGLYLLAAVGLVAGVVQLRTRQLRRRQETLETAVAERTEEIERQKEQLAEQAERLKELDEAKTRFFANVSHEFRTPITLILGPAQDLHDRVRRHLSEKDAEQLNVIERNAQRLLRLVDRVLGIARMEAGSYRLDARPTDLRSQVSRIVRSFVPLAERNELTLTVEEGAAEGGEEEREPVYVDREALEHVVQNLLSNAIKFTPTGGTIRVTVTPHAEAVELAVADTGPGIPEDEQAAVFDRFQQGRSSSGATTRPQEGAGIGLAFVRDLVDLHGGTIDLDSTEGEGTTVTVRLPRGREHLADAHLAESPESEAEDPAASAVPMVPPQMPVSSSRETGGDGAASPEDISGPTADVESDGADEQKKRVLVVEDNPDVRRYVRSILAPDFDVIEAADGEEGLEAARNQLPDVILADVMMPTMDGHEMTCRLKDDPETNAIPVIMVTARAGTGDEVEGLRVGADDYITKPFDANVLLQRVGGVITLQERLREQLRAEGGAEEEEQDAASADSEIVREARRAIREHLTDADFGATALAEELAMSRSALYRAFEEQADTTPSALITEERMERALSLLREERGTVTQVAYAVGYDRLSSFSRAFRSYAGQPPSAVVGTGSVEDESTEYD